MALAAVLPAGLQGQTNASAGSDHRFLVVVETSKAMHRRLPGVLEAVQGLINSRFDGQLRRGDTLAFWTYNERLYAGELPLQEWSPENQAAIALRILDFLQAQKYEKSGRIDNVIPEILDLARRSELITVIVLSAGSEPVEGTPFDDAITQRYAQLHDAQQKARMPIVTVFRGTRRRLTAWAVATVPGEIPLPPLAPVSKPAVQAKALVGEAVSPKALNEAKPTPLRVPAPLASPTREPTPTTSLVTATNRFTEAVNPSKPPPIDALLAAGDSRPHAVPVPAPTAPAIAEHKPASAMELPPHNSPRQTEPGPVVAKLKTAEEPAKAPTAGAGTPASRPTPGQQEITEKLALQQDGKGQLSVAQRPDPGETETPKPQGRSSQKPPATDAAGTAEPKPAVPAAAPESPRSAPLPERVAVRNDAPKPASRAPDTSSEALPPSGTGILGFVIDHALGFAIGLGLATAVVCCFRLWLKAFSRPHVDSMPILADFGSGETHCQVSAKPSDRVTATGARPHSGTDHKAGS